MPSAAKTASNAALYLPSRSRIRKRPEAVLADLDRVGPDTIVWLNEAQHYLMPADAGPGERVAAGLRTLLQDTRRIPALVLATLWPQYWSALTTRPDARQPDPYAQAREVLTGTAITVADGFTLDAELDGARFPGNGLSSDYYVSVLAEFR